MTCLVSNVKYRAIVLVGLALGLVILLAGCSKADQQVSEGLPAWIDETTSTAQAHEVTDQFNERNYEAVVARYVGTEVTVEQFHENFDELLNEYGAFKEYGDASFLQGESKGRSYATIIQKATYENGLGEFRVSFFEDGSLAGFYFLKN